MSHGANAGLPGAITLLSPIKEKFPEMGWADLIQVGGWVVGGPLQNLKLGTLLVV